MVGAVEPSARTTRGLPRHCSPPPPTECDTVVFRSPAAAIGRFRCPVHHPSFRDTGPIHDAVVVFPRTSVWIRHEGRAAFVADPNVVTIYNRGQRYERRPIAPDGDRCDWFAVSEELAREVAGRANPAAADSPERPFAFERAPSTMALYARQRRLMRRIELGAASTLEAEEEVLGIVSSVLALAGGATPAAARSAEAGRRRRDLAEAARAELVRTAGENRSVGEIARAVEASPFHLCRVFREQTGQTLHGYRVHLRLRFALERLEGPGASASLSAVAHELGFASHAHFVRVCRAQLGAAPSALRRQLEMGR